MDKGGWDLTSVKDTIKKCHRTLVSVAALRSSSGNFQNWSQSEPFKTQITFSQSQAATLKSVWVKPMSWQIASTHSRTISTPFWTPWPPSSLPWMLQLQPHVLVGDLFVECFLPCSLTLLLWVCCNLLFSIQPTLTSLFNTVTCGCPTSPSSTLNFFVTICLFLLFS